MSELKRYIYELRDEVNRDHGVCIDLEIDQLLKAVDPLLTDSAELNRKAHLEKNMTILALEARIKELEEALAFYGNPESYFAIGMLPDPPCGAFIKDFEDTGEEFGFQPGKLARKALGITLPNAPTREKDDER